MKRTVAVLVLWLGWAAGLPATSLLPMGLDDLTAASHAIVHGRIAASRTEWNQDRSLIFTVYTVVPTGYLKGRLGPSFELREPGGERDGLRMSIPSVPVFQVGQEVLVFVWTDCRGRHQVTGFEQGTLGVQTDPATGQKTVDRYLRLGSLKATASPSSLAAPASSRWLPQLLDQIRTSVVKTQGPATQ
ncbi:MAG: hypothetical protein A3H27_03060 [Acidobacteria bacterium RIFCSPLOWO2_02_FULL_59_13]|nr:MAG: hypothetical protein A3H27_03060 [Acidobacteria bacterium RIFCSPLOWO2_02_FULL_59_13]